MRGERRVRRAGRLALVVALIAACGFFIAATAAVYLRQIEQKALLTETIRASGWTAYQAQLEYVRSLGALDLALAAPSADRLGELSLRLEILLSRAPLITRSDEGDFLSGLPGVPAMAERLEAEVEAVLDEIYALDPDDPALRSPTTSGSTDGRASCARPPPSCRSARWSARASSSS